MLRSVLCAALALAAAPAAAEPALWRVADADTEIILFGSIHELPPGVTWLSPRIAARVDAADTLVLEAVLPDDPGVVAQLVARLGYSPAPPKLATRVAPSKRAALKAAIAKAGLSPDTLDLMETWLAAIALGDGVLSRLGFNAANGVEATLTARVRAADKPVTPLETLEQQFGFFDTLPETDQRALLDSTVDDAATMQADARRLIAAWLAGDTAAIAAEFKADALGATPTLERVLLRDRNARWADWVKTRLSRPGRVFVAVGAAHLAGPDALQAMLTARGVKVERLP